jgi:hypothetical protein
MVAKETLEAYEKAGIEYRLTPHDVAEVYFNNWIKQSGREPIIIVNRITRLKTKPDSKGRTEFITWSEKKIGYDHVGNEKSFTEDRCGQHIIPIFRNEFDQTTNTIKALQIERQETVYTTPYSPDKIDELNDLADPVKIQYYVQRGTNRYAIGDYDDFRDGKYEDLLQLGKSTKYYLRELYPERDERIIKESKVSITQDDDRVSKKVESKVSTSKT